MIQYFTKNSCRTIIARPNLYVQRTAPLHNSMGVLDHNHGVNPANMMHQKSPVIQLMPTFFKTWWTVTLPVASSIL